MEWEDLITFLSSNGRTDLSEELQVLTSIYTTTSLPPFSLYIPSSPSLTSASVSKSKPKSPNDKILLQLTTSTESPSSNKSHSLNLIISLPSTYPLSNPPSIQLSDIYIGPHLISDSLFGEVLRTFMHEPGGEGVEFLEGEVCLYEGIEYIRNLVGDWVDRRDDEKEVLEREREKDRGREEVLRRGDGLFKIPHRLEEKKEVEREEVWEEEEEMIRRSRELSIRTTKEKEKEVAIDRCPVIISSEPLVDRKSVFIAHSAHITNLIELNLVLNKLYSDKRIAKASHNMYAYHISQPTGIIMSDNSDDGESAAGGRLAHLLSLIDVTNVVVVVSRWFGGIHLGSDRFKHINSTAREALELGGFLEDKNSKGGGNKKGLKKK